MQERLQKILARADYGSRRSCEELIQQRRVKVNGKVVKLGDKADPELDRITVDGKLVQTGHPFSYIIINKPVNVLSDDGDDTGRPIPNVRDLVPVPGHLYPVGRLDLRSEGLILLTDDGDLANLLTHPRYEHSKEYRVLVDGYPSDEVLERWRQGVFLDERRTAPAEVVFLNKEKERSWLRVILREGRKRQIRRVAAKLGYPVRRLIRVRIGPIELGKLKPGDWRHLRPGEVKQLQEIKENRKLRKSR